MKNKYTGEKVGTHRTYREMFEVSLYEILRGMKKVSPNQAEFMQYFEKKRDNPSHW